MTNHESTAKGEASHQIDLLHHNKQAILMQQTDDDNAMQGFLEQLAADERLHPMTLTIGDGIEVDVRK